MGMGRHLRDDRFVMVSAFEFYASFAASLWLVLGSFIGLV